MNKEVLFTLLRALLTLVGTYLIGKPLFGGTIDDNVLQVIFGAVMSIAGLAWSVFDKTIGLEMIQAFIRSVGMGIGGILIANGKLSAEKLETYLGAILALSIFLHSWLGKKKNDGIVNGTIPPAALKNTTQK
jgi:hypothetical protein